jgi:hypothetical protein
MATKFTPLTKESRTQSFPAEEPPHPSSRVRKLYLPIEPYETGFLPVGDGHELYYEISGERTLFE